MDYKIEEISEMKNEITEYENFNKILEKVCI